MGEFDPAPIIDELLAVFPPSLADKPLSGFTTIFDDANFPDFGADIQVENSIEDPKTCSVSIYSDTDFQPWPIAVLIPRYCQPRSEERRVRKECVRTCTSMWSPCH